MKSLPIHYSKAAFVVLQFCFLLGGLMSAKAQVGALKGSSSASLILRQESPEPIGKPRQEKQLIANNTALTIANLEPNSYTICQGDVVVLSATILNSPGRYRYTISDGRTTSTGTASGPQFRKSIVTTESGLQTYTLVVNGLRGRALATVPVFIPPYTQCRFTNVSNSTGCGSSTATIGQPLKLLKPTYDCTTRMIKLNVEGGNGNPIEFMAISLTPWTTNCYHETELLEWDLPIPMTIYARQNQGSSYETVKFIWDYREYWAARDSCYKLRGSVEPISRQENPELWERPRQEKQLIANNTALTITNLKPNSYTICLGDVTVLSATILNSPGRYRYTISNGRTSSTGTASGSQFKKSIAVVESGIQTYTLTINSIRGRALATVAVFVPPIGQCRLTNEPNPTDCGSPTVTIGQPLKLLMPTYDCTTKMVKLNVEGGNGSPIEFLSIGLTPWTTNCYHSIESLLIPDNAGRAGIRARQYQGNGKSEIDTLTWNFYTAVQACARVDISLQSDNGLQVKILGNPVHTDEAELQLTGAENQEVSIVVSDVAGNRITEQRIEKVTASEQYRVKLGASRSMYFVQISTPTQRKIIKVLRQ